jgi:hypothetical protein
MNQTFEIGKYKVSEMCLQSFPCQHHVEDTLNENKFIIRGDKFYTMLENDGLSYEHFDRYKKFIEKCKNNVNL